jgi:nucleoside-diphosphate-sugar epimerase
MTVFIFGFGYAAGALARQTPCVGTRRIGSDTPPFYAWDGRAGTLSPAALGALRDADAVLVTVPPSADGDPVFRAYGGVIAQKKNLRWLGYISSTGVYGDADGAWVDEETPAIPDNDAGRHRLVAEKQWLSLFDCPVHIFRASGIYGPGRGPLERAAAGAPIITKTGHVMNRIHVDDMATVLCASLAAPAPGTIYNLADDEPAASSVVLQAAYEKLGRVPPVPVAYESADLTPMARGFFAGCKRIRNDKIKKQLGVTLRYPTWRAALDT